MQDEAAVAEESADAVEGRREVVRVRGGEGPVVARSRADVAMLARQVADLARLRARGVAWRLLAALERVQVREGRGAVAVSGDGLVVDVVDCGGGNTVPGQDCFIREEEFGLKGGGLG